MGKLISIISFVLLCFNANQVVASPAVIYNDTLLPHPADTLLFALKMPEEIPSAFPVKMDEQKRQKLISAMLAFPFPFGFMGAHRVMLGCKPWVPVVYVVTFGGCFGILPLIDFCAILASKDITQYENNPHVFMWLK